MYIYFLNATSGVAESSPDVIKPDTNAGTKRWILKKAIMDYADITGNDAATDVTAAELEELSDASETTLHSHAEGGTTDDHSDISTNDAATDVTGAELEELTDASETTLHSHAAGGTDADYSDISTNDGTTDVTGAELEELTDGSETTKHSHAGGGGGTWVDRGDPAANDTIGGGVLDSTWRVWDASAIVPAAGANKAVLIRVDIQSATVGAYFRMRKNGNSNDKNTTSAYVSIANVANPCDLIVTCDSDRKIEYNGTATIAVFNICVAGWWT